MLVVNQLKVLLPHVDGAGRDLLQLMSAQLISALWQLSDIVLVPDLPPPYTIAEEQVRGLPLVKNKVAYIGPIVSFSTSTCEELLRFVGTAEKLAVFSISGPEETKPPVLMLARAAARILERRSWRSVVSAGRAGSGTRPRKLSEDVIEYEWCPCLDWLLAKADIVVARAGHATVTKLAYLGRPAVLVPIPFHGEQESNAIKAEKLGFAKAVLRSDLVKPSDLAEVVEEVFADEAAARAAAQVSRIARAVNPPSSLLAYVDSLASLGAQR